ncbi:uncharacterized protein [Euphorbia lathyris]|uniref:uncharacterized protein n=1 Tax=Euphorbia lathyris TaxID=212925 RepID=UPI00331328D7
MFDNDPAEGLAPRNVVRMNLKNVKEMIPLMFPNKDDVEDSLASTFRPRAQPLFQYRHYSEQQPLRLNPAEVCEVIAAVSSKTLSKFLQFSVDVVVSVLIKLLIDI